MSIGWSPSTMGFYDHDESVPDDVRYISEERWLQLLDAQSLHGHIIVNDASGFPINQPRPDPTPEQLIVIADVEKSSQLKSAMQTISLWQTQLQLGMISDADKASLIAWMNYITALQSVDTSTAPDIDWPTPPDA